MWRWSSTTARSDTAAAVFTANRVKAAPVLWTQQCLTTGELAAVILNSGGANACTGPDGFADTHHSAEHVAGLLGVGPIEVAVCSTGLIGVRLPMDRLLPGADAAAAALATDGGPAAARAIMTTDSVPKTAHAQRSGVTVGGMAKGAGMLAPGMATMLSVITTDAVVDAGTADAVLREATALSFDRIDSDGCMSTNDTVILMASGASGVTLPRADLQELVTAVATDLAEQLIADAEGASKDILIRVANAATVADAQTAARAVARSNLLKTAIHGEDPNWGRVLAAIGTTDAAFEPGLRRCRHQRRLGVPERDAGGGPRPRVHDRPAGRCRHRPARRRRLRVDPDQRPDRGLRPRELGVLDMSILRRIDHGTAMANAAILAQALPWLKRFHGATVVVKYGGNAMIDDQLKRSFASDIVFLRLAGLRPVVVHGGGPQITSMLQRLDVYHEWRSGYRVTTPEAMDVVRMVLTGQVQREIVGLINEHGPYAVGISGEDAHLFTAVQRLAMVDGERIDIGQVGDIAEVRPDFVTTLLNDNLIPVVSSIGLGSDGAVYNVNADAAAAALAAALPAEKLIMLTDVEGLYVNWPESQEVVRTINATELSALLPSLAAGMVPKMQACLDAVTSGVSRAHVIDGRLPHSLLLEVFTDVGVGTMVLPDGAVDA